MFRDQGRPVYLIPPANKWTNRDCKRSNGTVLTLLCELPSRGLGYSLIPCQIACKNAVFVLTKVTLIFANLSIYPCLVIKQPRPKHSVQRDQAQYKLAEELAERLVKIRNFAIAQLHFA